MNSSIRSVIRLKSPSIKLLWLLIYNLYATGRLMVSIFSLSSFEKAHNMIFSSLSKHYHAGP